MSETLEPRVQIPWFRRSQCISAYATRFGPSKRECRSIRNLGPLSGLGLRGKFRTAQREVSAFMRYNQSRLIAYPVYCTESSVNSKTIWMSNNVKLNYICIAVICIKSEIKSPKWFIMIQCCGKQIGHLNHVKGKSWPLENSCQSTRY